MWHLQLLSSICSPNNNCKVASHLFDPDWVARSNHINHPTERHIWRKIHFIPNVTCTLDNSDTPWIWFSICLAYLIVFLNIYPTEKRIPYPSLGEVQLGNAGNLGCHIHHHCNCLSRCNSTDWDLCWPFPYIAWSHRAWNRRILHQSR